MKKTIIAIIFIILCTIILIGCTNAKVPKLTTSEIIEVPDTTITPNTESNATITPEESVQENELNDIICEESIMFTTPGDLHTFITTGSTDPNDYSEEYYVGMIESDLEYLVRKYPPEKLRKIGYINVKELFDVDFESFERLNAGFYIYNGRFVCSYRFDDICVSIQAMQNLDETILSTENIKEFNGSIHEKNSCSIREYNNIEVVYKHTSSKPYDSGIELRNIFVEFVIDKFYVSIHFYGINKETGAYGNLKNIDELYNEIMTQPKYASFAKLFSSDEQVFNNVISSYLEVITATTSNIVIPSTGGDTLNE